VFRTLLDLLVFQDFRVLPEKKFIYICRLSFDRKWDLKNQMFSNEVQSAFCVRHTLGPSIPEGPVLPL